MGRRSANNGTWILIGSFALVGVLWNFFARHLWVLILIVVIALAVIAIVIWHKRRQANAWKAVVTEEDKTEIANIIAYVFPDGNCHTPSGVPVETLRTVLCQVYSWDYSNSLKQYETQAHAVYERILSQRNPYDGTRHSQEFQEHLLFAFENTMITLVNIEKNKSQAQKHFAGLDNLSRRLLQMNSDMFKNLFILLSQYHFWFVYTEDKHYRHMLGKIKKALSMHKGIKQTDFYKTLGRNKDDVSHALYFAEKAGEITRVKSGRTYQLYLPGQEETADRSK